MGNASVGGSKDTSNSTGCMDANQMPDIASLTYEGLYYDYYFQTKNDDEEEKKENLINPTYSCAKTKIPRAFKMLQLNDAQFPKEKKQEAMDFAVDFSNTELQELFKAFKALDTDNDGYISKDAYINSEIFQNNPLDTNVLDTILNDSNADKIDFTEFVKCIHSSRFPEQNQDVNTDNNKDAVQGHIVQTDDIKDEFEYYMTIGLNSTIDSNNLQRNKLNLVIVLDNSGSMRSTFRASEKDSQTKRELPPQCPICNKFINVTSNSGSPDLLVGQHIDSGCQKSLVNDEEQSKLEQLHKTERKCVMDVANQSVLSLLQQLNEDDRFGLVVFNSKCKVYQPLMDVKDINMDKLKQDIINIKAGGGTNMELAYKTATKLYDDFFAKQGEEVNEDEAESEYVKVVYPSPNGDNDAISNDEEGNILDEYWNRIIFITDAMPTSGKTDAESIMNLIQRGSDGDIRKADKPQQSDAAKNDDNEQAVNNQVMETNENAQKEVDDEKKDENDNEIVDEIDKCHIYTTFIGVGLNMNAALIDEITKVRGCNYYSVHSNKQFMKKMTEEFKFMVTPIAFDFKLNLCTEGNGMCIDSVYGSGDDKKNKEYGFEVMNVGTLFPSPYNESNEIKGGIILLKLKTNANNDIIQNMEIDVSYKEVATGKIFKDKQSIVFGERNKNKKDDMSDYFDHVGIRKAILLTRHVNLLKKWITNDQRSNGSRSGNSLYVSPKFKKIFATFMGYFREEMKNINDEVLQKEVDLMQKLVDC